MKRRNRWIDDEGGQALIEFALITPFLLMMLIGIIEFGRAWNLHQVVTDASREGARKGAIWDPTITENDVRTVVLQRLGAAGVPPAAVTVTMNNVLGGTDTPLNVRVSVPYRFMFFGPLVGWTLGQRDIQLVASTTMRNE
jgi:Flp pilus assembly protein TadG